MSADWPPALHAWPGGPAKDYPGAEPRSLVVGRGGDGSGGGVGWAGVGGRGGGGQKLSEPLSGRPGLGPGGAAWVTVTRGALHASASACGALGRGPPAHPRPPRAPALRAPRRAMPTLPSIPLAWAGSWGRGTGPAPCHSPGQVVPSLAPGRGAARKALALLVRPNRSTTPARSCPKGSFAPAAAARAGGSGWRSKALPFSQAQAPASPRLGPSAIAGAVKTGASLSTNIGPGAMALREPLRRRRADPGGQGAPARQHPGAGSRAGGRRSRGTGVSAARCRWVTARGPAGGFCCVRGRVEVGLGCGLGRAARWCALELGALPGGRGTSPELAGPSFLGLSGQLACITFLLWRLSGLSLAREGEGGRVPVALPSSWGPPG